MHTPRRQCAQTHTFPACRHTTCGQGGLPVVTVVVKDGLTIESLFNPLTPAEIYASHRFWDAYVPQSPSAKQFWDVLIQTGLLSVASLGCICPSSPVVQNCTGKHNKYCYPRRRSLSERKYVGFYRFNFLKRHPVKAQKINFICHVFIA